MVDSITDRIPDLTAEGFQTTSVASLLKEDQQKSYDGLGTTAPTEIQSDDTGGTTLGGNVEDDETTTTVETPEDIFSSETEDDSYPPEDERLCVSTSTRIDRLVDSSTYRCSFSHSDGENDLHATVIYIDGRPSFVDIEDMRHYDEGQVLLPVMFLARLMQFVSINNGSGGSPFQRSTGEPR